MNKKSISNRNNFIKYLEIRLTKHEHLYTEIYKALLRNIKADQNKQRDTRGHGMEHWILLRGQFSENVPIFSFQSVSRAQEAFTVLQKLTNET